jgi:heat shock transcription factor
LQQLVEKKEWRKELEEVFSKKRRRTIDQGLSNVEVGDDELGYANEESLTYVKLEPCQQDVEEHGNLMNQFEIRDKEIDVEVFWQDLFKESIEDEVDIEDVDVLAEQLGYLASSPPN